MLWGKTKFRRATNGGCIAITTKFQHREDAKDRAIAQKAHDTLAAIGKIYLLASVNDIKTRFPNLLLMVNYCVGQIRLADRHISQQADIDQIQFGQPRTRAARPMTSNFTIWPCTWV